MNEELIKADELRKYDLGRLRELEESTRKKLLELRMDIYSLSGAKTGAKKMLRRNLARILTVKTEKLNKKG